MTQQANALDELRAQLLAEPGMILDDHDLMKALARAQEGLSGDNVVDLRGAALNRLESRFEQLEDTHRTVIAAAYENISGTRQIQRAVLAMLEPLDFTEFLQTLRTDVASILKVDSLRLCLETPSAGNKTQSELLRIYGDAIGFYAPGSVEEYITDGRNVSMREVTLRQVSNASETLYGDKATWIRSEGLLKLDLGGKNLPGMLAMGSEDPHLFHPNQGTDLLEFFRSAFERVMRRWLD